METIFDHGVTKREVRLLMGYDCTEERLKKKFDQISNYGLIYRLYYMRGNIEKMREYLAKIPNSDWKNFTLSNHDHNLQGRPDNNLNNN